MADNRTFFSFSNVASFGNRGWGIYSVGGDANAGNCFHCQTYGSQWGGIFDNSGFGDSWYGSGSHTDNRSAVLVGTTQAVSTIAFASGTCTLTTTVALANGVPTVNTGLQ